MKAPNMKALLAVTEHFSTQTKSVYATDYPAQFPLPFKHEINILFSFLKYKDFIDV